MPPKTVLAASSDHLGCSAVKWKENCSYVACPSCRSPRVDYNELREHGETDDSHDQGTIGTKVIFEQGRWQSKARSEVDGIVVSLFA